MIVVYLSVFISFILKLYSVMQSYKNSFCEDVVLNSFNMVYRDDDINLDQIYIKQSFWYLYFYFIFFILGVIAENAYIKKNST